MKITKQALREAKAWFRACQVNGILDENRVRVAVQQIIAKKSHGYLAVLTQIGRLVKIDQERRTANVEYVQEASIRNKRLLEETDPAIRKQRLDEMRRASQTPALAKEVVMKSSMIASMRRANAIT